MVQMSYSDVTITWMPKLSVIMAEMQMKKVCFYDDLMLPLYTVPHLMLPLYTVPQSFVVDKRH